MTPAQLNTMKNLIDADREYRTRVNKGEPVGPYDRGIEVGWSCSPVTARYLESMGLAEIVSGENAHSSWIFLGKFNPYNEA